MLSLLQERFVDWMSIRNSEDKNISRCRYLTSLSLFQDGHGGSQFREFCEKSYQLFLPFFSDNIKESLATYRYYGHLHFLRMLSYPEPAFKKIERIRAFFPVSKQIRILDYGCGLAQFSRALARNFAIQGHATSLFLADIPTERLAFLDWNSACDPFETIILECRSTSPINCPEECHVIVATEFLEHVHNPIEFIQTFHKSLVPGGIFNTQLHLHDKEFMHVTPNLTEVSKLLDNLGYKRLEETLWRKPENAQL